MGGCASGAGSSHDAGVSISTGSTHVLSILHLPRSRAAGIDTASCCRSCRAAAASSLAPAAGRAAPAAAGSLECTAAAACSCPLSACGLGGSSGAAASHSRELLAVVNKHLGAVPAARQDRRAKDGLLAEAAEHLEQTDTTCDATDSSGSHHHKNHKTAMLRVAPAA
jgi:hypothetical protein